MTHVWELIYISQASNTETAQSIVTRTTSKVTYLIPKAYTGTCVSHTYGKK